MLNTYRIRYRRNGRVKSQHVTAASDTEAVDLARRNVEGIGSILSIVQRCYGKNADGSRCNRYEEGSICTHHLMQIDSRRRNG
jgi:hypothetical protein